MAGKSRDVKLTLSVETLGEDGIKTLQRSIQDLANEGGSAAPEFQALADEVGRLGQQSAAVDTLARLSKEAEDLRASQAAAALASEALAGRLLDLQRSTDAAREKQQTAAAAFTQGQKAVTDVATAIRVLQTEYDSAGRQTADYRARLAELVTAQGAAKNTLLDLRTAQREANTEANAAESAQRKAESAYTATAQKVETATTALKAQESAVKAASDAAEALGIATNDIAGAQGTLLASLKAAGTGAQLLEQGLRGAEDATKKVQAAFGSLNIRSADDINADLARVRQALDTVRTISQSSGQAMAGAFAAGQSRVKALELELRQLNGTLTTGDKLAGLFKGSLGQISAGNIIADGVGYLVNKVQELGRAFVSSIAQGEQFRRGLNAIYKDADTTARQLDFVRATAQSAGVAVADIAPAFVKFSAATKSANIPLEQTNALFAAVTGAAGTLGLSGESVTGMLEALGQMASKGTVSLEELRQQLGDRLPGALSLVAQGFGISESALIKLVESGSLAARDLFPALTKALQGMQGETTGLTSTFENLKSVLVGIAQDAGDAGWAVLLNGALKGLGGTLGLIGLSLSVLTEGLFTVGKAALVFIEVLRGNGTQALAFFNDEVEKTNVRLDKQALRFKAMLDPAGEAATRLREMATAQSTVTDATARATIAAEALNTALPKTAAGLAAQKLAADSAGVSSGDLSTRYVKLASDLETVLVSLAKQTEAYDKQAKASKVEGDALVTLTALRGNERATLEASAQAAEINVTALQRSATAHAEETEVLEQKRNALIQLAQQQDGDLSKRQQELDAINRKILVSKAETEQAQAAANAARVEALARDINLKAYEGNTQALGALERAMVAAGVTEQNYARQLAEGRITADQYRDAQDRLTTSTALYNRALQDASRLVLADSAAKQANYSITLASLGVQSQAYDRLAAAARATGDLAQATYYEIEAKRIQIQVTQLTAEAKKKEAEASILAANAELDALKKTGALTEIKRLEIEARIANAKAKAIEAGASADVVRALEAEITAIRNNLSSRAAGVSSLDADTSARNRNRDAIDGQTAALVKQKTTSDGFAANKDGSAAGTFNNTVGVDKAFAIKEKSQAGTLTAADLPLAEAGFAQARAALAYAQQAGTAASPAAGRSAEGLFIAAQIALQRVKDLVAGNTIGAKKGPGSAAGAQGGSYTVNVNMGGKSTAINTASQADASALVGLLQGLETAAARSF